MKVSIIPWIVKKLKLCFALVEDGDTASQNIAQGKFVIWKGVCTKAASAITAGTTLTGTNLPAISGGALNDISASIPAVVNNLTSDSTTSALSAAQGKALNEQIAKFGIPTSAASDLNDCKTPGYYRADGYTANRPSGAYLAVTVMPYGANDLAQFAVDVNNGKQYSRSFKNGTTWTEWISLSDQIANIGTVVQGTGQVTSVASATYTTVQTATISKGTWIILRGCDFASNATGIRRVGADDSSGRNASANKMAVSGTDTYLQFIDYKTVNSDTTINNVVYQTSGSTLNIWPYMFAVRIK